MKTVTLTKVATVEGAPHPGKPIGYERSGVFHAVPQIGKNFLVGLGKQAYRTSPVLEILEGNKFRTYNSIYQYKIHE